MLERNKARAVRVHREHKQEVALATGAGVGVATAVAAAFADQKMGAGQQWKVGPLPVVGVAGVAALVPAFFVKDPIARAASVSAGMTAINISLYRYLQEEQIPAGTP
jgi:hypothetical protein